MGILGSGQESKSLLNSAQGGIVCKLKDINPEKLVAYKNIICLGLSFMLLFTAFNALKSLQSSLHSNQYLGVVSLSVIYICFSVSCLLFPSLIIEKLGLKWTLLVSSCGYVSFTAAHFYPSWWTLIPTSTVLGLSAAPLWCAQASYVTATAVNYARLAKESQDDVIARSFGMFNMVLFSNQIWGNLISSTVLRSGESNFNASSYNGTLCAAKFCPSMPISASRSAAPSAVRVLTTAYLTCGILAVLLLLFLVDQLPEGGRQGNSTALLLGTLRNMRTKKALLLAPFTFFVGIEGAFFASEFTKAYITCVLGIDKVGIIIICQALCMILSSALVARFLEVIGRLKVIVGTAILHATLFVLLRTYATTVDPTAAIYLYFVVAGLWGVCEGIWQTNVKVLFGVAFASDNSAAFSTMNLWQSLGYAAAFSYSGYLCTDVKMYIVIAWLLLGVACCVFLEMEIKKSAQEEKKHLICNISSEDLAANDL